MGSSLSTKLKVGFTSILAVVVLVGGIFWVKQYNPMVGRVTMTVAFDDGRGIYAGDPVKVSGIKVGEVVGTSLGDDNRALITFSIRDDIRLAADTRFLIRDVGLMGDMMIIIEPGASPEEIEQRVMQMVTDPARKRRSDPGEPTKCNIYSLHQHFSTPEDLDHVAQGCRSAGIGCIDCKKILFERMMAVLEPIRKRAEELLAEPDGVWDVLRRGADRCRQIAATTMDEVRKAMGLR